MSISLLLWKAPLRRPWADSPWCAAVGWPRHLAGCSRRTNLCHHLKEVKQLSFQFNFNLITFRRTWRLRARTTTQLRPGPTMPMPMPADCLMVMAQNRAHSPSQTEAVALGWIWCRVGWVLCLEPSSKRYLCNSFLSELIYVLGPVRIPKAESQVQNRPGRRISSRFISRSLPRDVSRLQLKLT